MTTENYFRIFIALFFIGSHANASDTHVNPAKSGGSTPRAMGAGTPLKAEEKVKTPEIIYNETKAALLAVRKSSNAEVVAALKILFSNRDFIPEIDTATLKSNHVGLLTRELFIKLDGASFIDVVSASPEFFKTNFAVSLVHGWMLNKFTTTDTPAYIGNYFSFDRFFLSMINAMPGEVQPLLKRVWRSARHEVESERWAYYHHMLPLSHAIEVLRKEGLPAGTLPNMEAIIRNANVNDLADIAFLNKPIAEFLTYVDTKNNEFSELKFQKTMAWLLNRFNLGTLLPEGQRIANVGAFVAFVVEHVKELWQDPRPGNNLNNIPLRDISPQNGIGIINVLMPMMADLRATYENDDLARGKINLAMEMVKKNRRRPASPLKITASLLPIYTAAASHFMGASPSKLGGSKVPKLAASATKTKLEHEGVYHTPLMQRWMDAAAAGTTLVGLTAYEAADILKYFESYLLSDAKKADRTADKGSHVGKVLNYTYLSEVRAHRLRILANPNDDAILRDVLAFVNKCKEKFLNSLKTNGFVE